MRSSSEQAEIAARIILMVRSRRATSRRKLSDLLRLSPTTAGMYVDQLIAQGFLDELGLERGSMGRPKRLLDVRAAAGWFAGVELNAERIQAVALDFSGAVRSHEMAYLPQDAEVGTVLEKIEEMIAIVNRSMRDAGQMLGIGVGAPGLVKPSQGQALHYAYIKGWKDVMPGDRLQKQFHVPVTVENNLRVIALAERWHGSGRDLMNYVILGPRSGFGLAMVQDGQLVQGARFAAGEIGRWPWPFDRNGSAPHGELQEPLAAPGVYRRLAGAGPASPLPKDLHRALSELNAASSPGWHEVVGDYARVISCLHLLLDAEAYLLHGPLTALGKPFCDSVSEAALQISPALQNGGFRLEPSLLGDDAGALGAASLAMEAWTPTEVG